jgi:hypothetical protein
MAIERNPYAPPAAEVADSNTSPTQISLALLLLAVGWFLASVRAVLRERAYDVVDYSGRANWDGPLSWLIPALVISGIASLWLYGMHRRKGWLWWPTVILGVLEVL